MQVEENTMNQFMTTSKSINNNENKENMKGSTSSNTPPILLKYKGQNYFLFHKFTNTSTSQQQEEYQVILPNRDSLFTSDKLNTLMEELSQLFNIQNDVFLFFPNPISLRFGINITYSQELTLSDIAALYFGLRTNSDPFIVELQEDSSNFFREYNALVEKSQEKERSNNVNNSFSSKLEVQEDLNELQEEESSVTTNQTNLNQSSNIIEKEEEQEDDEVNNFAIVDQNEEEQETVAGTSSSSLVNPSEEVEQQEQNNNEEGDAGLNTESDDHVTGDITAADLDEGFVSVADNEGEEDADNAQQQLNSDEINQLQSEQQVEDATEYIEAADEMQVDEVQSQVQLSQSQQQQQQQQFQSQLNSFENSNSQLESSILTKSTSNNAIESTSSSSFINAAQTQATDSTTEDQNSLANVEEEVEEQENESTKSNAKKREREDSSNGYSSQEDILIDANGNYLETELNDNRYYEPAFKRQKVEATI